MPLLALKTIEELLPIKNLMHTITADNGKEFAKHQEMAKELEISFYFCKSYHSWKRGAKNLQTSTASGVYCVQIEIEKEPFIGYLCFIVIMK